MISIDSHRIAIPDNTIPQDHIAFYWQGKLIGTYAQGSEEAVALAMSGDFNVVRMSPQMCWIFQRMKIERAFEALQTRH